MGRGLLAWSSDDHWIARIADSTLEVVDITHAAAGDDRLPLRSIGLRRLGTPGVLEWSPDNVQLATVDSDGDIVVIDVDAGSARKVTTGGSFGPKELLPAPRIEWSPDGSRLLAFDGDRMLIITIGTGDVQPLELSLVNSGPWGWAPDGRVAIGLWNGATLDPGDVDDALAIQMAGGCFSAPAWSPTDGELAQVRDGRLVLGLPDSESTTPTLGSDLCAINDQLTLHWSPDGEWIAVEREDPDAAGSDPTYSVTIIARSGEERYELAADDRDFLEFEHELRWPD